LRKNWFYRLLFSYFPIFFSLTSVLILLTFLLLSEFSRRETINANQTYVQHVIQLIDHTLRQTDNMLIGEIETDEKIRGYFQDNNGAQSHYNVYEISKKINEIATFNHFIDSMYLYRYSDDMVMSTNTLVPLEQFGDREFVYDRMNTPAYYELSAKRTYIEFQEQERFPASVVSMVRKYPLLEGGQGLIVLNISLSEIEKMLTELSDSNVSFVEVKDRDGNTIIGQERSEHLPGTVLSEVVSDLTNWSYTGGVHDIKLFRFASIFTYVWVVIGLAAVIACTVWMTYVTKRNYKPIESIINRINMYSMQKNELHSKADDFQFIEQAIDNMIVQSNTYQKMSEEDSLYRRRHFFVELVEGTRSIGSEEWRTELERFGLPAAYTSLGVTVYEIDKYTSVTTRYSYRDFYLLKFVLNSVIKEIAESHRVIVWTEWTDQHRLTALYQLEEGTVEGESFLLSLAESVREWVEKNLDFTVSAGVGASVERSEDTSHSYDGANHALAYKPSLGLNRVISHRENNNKPEESYRYLQLIRAFAQSFRMGEQGWQQRFSEIFLEVNAKRFTKEELVQLLNVIIQHLYRELSEFPEDIQKTWQIEVVPRLNDVRDTFDLAVDVERQFHEILTEFNQHMDDIRESRNHANLMQEVRSYIELNYANGDLSLNHLCDVFGLNGKYLSKLFKETFGEKLVDYMVGVRIDNSKKLLRETSLSLQQIANAVGYFHDISYIRVFKKIVGTTPGEYRKSQGQGLSE
jgi:two-component system response regulator YesN